MIFVPDFFAATAFFEPVFVEPCLTRCFFLVFFMDDISCLLPVCSRFGDGTRDGMARTHQPHPLENMSQAGWPDPIPFAGVIRD
jgi:hypothetical protein